MRRLLANQKAPAEAGFEFGGKCRENQSTAEAIVDADLDGVNV